MSENRTNAEVELRETRPGNIFEKLDPASSEVSLYSWTFHGQFGVSFLPLTSGGVPIMIQDSGLSYFLWKVLLQMAGELGARAA